jgi:glutathione peroxidase-family protein
MRFLGAADVLQRGFHVCEGLPSRNFDRQEPTKHDVKLFKKHYGSDLAVLAKI